MDHQIGLTPMEIWNGILGLAQAVAVIWAAYLVIKQVVANAQAPDHKQNERLDLIEERLAKIEAHITTDRTDISDLKEGRRIEMQALQVVWHWMPEWARRWRIRRASLPKIPRRLRPPEPQQTHTPPAST